MDAGCPAPDSRDSKYTVLSRNLERKSQATLQVEANDVYSELRGAILESDVEIVRDLDRVIAAWRQARQSSYPGSEGNEVPGGYCAFPSGKVDPEDGTPAALARYRTILRKPPDVSQDAPHLIAVVRQLPDRSIPNAAAGGDVAWHRSTKDPHRQGSAPPSRRYRAG